MLDFGRGLSLSEKITGLINTALEAENLTSTKRSYLGGSRLGVECARALQYEYTQTPPDPERGFKGKTLRIFAAGHLYEELAIKWLRMAGFELWTTKASGGQFGFQTMGGKIKGHTDGAIVSAPEGLGFNPTMDDPSLWECKSLNAKSWNDTVSKGVAVSKPVYATQIAIYQAYMGWTKNPALFTAVNKDTCELYFELVPFDAVMAQRASDKGVRIIEASDNNEVLPRCAATRSAFACKFCDWQDRCWEGV